MITMDFGVQATENHSYGPKLWSECHSFTIRKFLAWGNSIHGWISVFSKINVFFSKKLCMKRFIIPVVQRAKWATIGLAFWHNNEMKTSWSVGSKCFLTENGAKCPKNHRYRKLFLQEIPVYASVFLRNNGNIPAYVVVCTLSSSKDFGRTFNRVS